MSLCVLAAGMAIVPPEFKAEFKPWEHPECWARELRSKRYPLQVSYSFESDDAIARQVLATLEEAWQWQVEEVGFIPPFPRDPSGSGLYPVYLIRGAGTGVNSSGPLVRSDVNWSAHASYMTVDAWGPYAGSALEQTIHHEFQHALEAAYDWDEPGSIFEMSANFIQEKARPGMNPGFDVELADFQARPQLAPHAYDDYETYFMYGSWMYLAFLEQRYFPIEGAKLVERIWSGARSAPGQAQPDWIDSLGSLLPKGTGYSDTVIEFARWRWYAGKKTRPALWPFAYAPAPEHEVRVSGSLEADSPAVRIEDTRLLGTTYLRVPKPVGCDEVSIEFSGAPDAGWVLQAMPSLVTGVDGDRIEARLPFGDLSERTLAVTAIPLSGTRPVPVQSDAEYPYQIRVECLPAL